jgi:hypothetical protein
VSNTRGIVTHAMLALACALMVAVSFAPAGAQAPAEADATTLRGVAEARLAGWLIGRVTGVEGPEDWSITTA